MSNWHDTYEPAATSRQFPHGSVFRHWARKPGDTRRLPVLDGHRNPHRLGRNNVPPRPSSLRTQHLHAQEPHALAC